MENRKYTRLNLDVMAEVHLPDGSCLYGETADLSLDGAFVSLAPPRGLSNGERCRLLLILKSHDNWVKTEFQASIAHVKEDGVGLRFEQANIKHHEAFLKLLIDGADNIDVLLEELSGNPRTEFAFIDR